MTPGERTAFHEAGHAVVATALGSRLTDVSMSSAPDAADLAGFCTYSRPQTSVEQAAAALAGGVAVWIAFGTWQDAGVSVSDAESARSLTPDELAAAVDLAVRTLMREWVSVEALAGSLLRNQNHRRRNHEQAQSQLHPAR